MIWQIEMTDTFGGEPNYSWVKRFWTDRDLTARQAVRLAKKMTDLQGVPCKKVEHDDQIELRPRGMHAVLFVTSEDIAQGVGRKV